MKFKHLVSLLAVAITVKASALVIDVANDGESLAHYWSEGTCAGRVNEGLRASLLEQLALVKKECGFHYLRMHGLFDDDMFVYFANQDGRPVYHWQNVDEVYDRMLDLNVKPFF